MKIPQNITIFGDTEFRGVCPTEGAELMTLVSTVKAKYPGVILIHQKNEGRRTWRQASVDKSIGALDKGASDIVLIGYSNMCCLFIELKRKDHTKSIINDEQIKYLRRAYDMGHLSCVALGYEAALQAIDSWVNGELNDFLI